MFMHRRRSGWWIVSIGVTVNLENPRPTAQTSWDRTKTQEHEERLYQQVFVSAGDFFA